MLCMENYEHPVMGEPEARLGLGRRKAGSVVSVRTGQRLGLVIEQNGWQINPVKFFEESK